MKYANDGEKTIIGNHNSNTECAENFGLATACCCCCCCKCLHWVLSMITSKIRFYAFCTFTRMDVLPFANLPRTFTHRCPE